MSTICIALLLFAAQPTADSNSQNPPSAAISQASATPTKQQEKMVPVRKGKELETATHETLRRWAKVDKANAKTAAREFIALFNELKQDTTLARSTREQLGGQVRSRLVRLAETIQKSENEIAKSKSPANLDGVKNQPNVLGQFGGFGNPNQGIQGGGFGGNGTNAYPPDYGEDLVALIQKTISPSSWDINGGPGSIQYWRPGHALVVRASEAVHEEIGGVMDQLHRGQQ